jgi:hypothetical protein
MTNRKQWRWLRKDRRYLSLVGNAKITKITRKMGNGK